MILSQNKDNGISNPTLHKSTRILDAVPCVYMFTTAVSDGSPLQEKNITQQLANE